MYKSFEVCDKNEIDIYDFILEVLLLETGMDECFLVQSQPNSEIN
jgi:hypothetical protein